MPVYQYWLDILIIFTATLSKINTFFMLALMFSFERIPLYIKRVQDLISLIVNFK